MAPPANNGPLSLAPWTNLSKQVVVSSTKLDSSCDFSLSPTLIAIHYVVSIFSARSFTMRTSHLLLNHDIKLLAKIKVLEFQKDFDLELWPFKLVEVKFIVDIRIIHLLDTHTVIQILFTLVVQRLISYVNVAVPLLIFSNRALWPGLRSGWYFLVNLRKASLTSSKEQLTGSSESNKNYLRRHNKCDQGGTGHLWPTQTVEIVSYVLRLYSNWQK